MMGAEGSACDQDFLVIISRQGLGFLCTPFRDSHHFLPQYRHRIAEQAQNRGNREVLHFPSSTGTEQGEQGQDRGPSQQWGSRQRTAPFWTASEDGYENKRNGVPRNQ